MKLGLSLLMICGLSVATGCGSGDDDDAEPAAIDCSTDTTTYTDVSAFDKCVMCHSSELTGAKRMSAPPEINFDTIEGATATKSLKAPDEIEEGAMPPKDSGVTITKAQGQQLIAWYKCGKKE
jgi:uncharacterized membrane protein